MVRVGDAHIRCGSGSQVGDDVVVNFPIICIKFQIHRNVGIQRFKIGNGLFVNIGLSLVGIVLAQKVTS